MIGRDHGAWVPFLRSPEAAQDDSMEEHVLADLDEKLKTHGIEPPDILVWLRPTFPFRAVEDLRTALAMLDEETHSVRLVTEGEPRLYTIQDDFLVPQFEDHGRSMVRRQEFPASYKVFHTDVFWYRNIQWGYSFLGHRVKAVWGVPRSGNPPDTAHPPGGLRAARSDYVFGRDYPTRDGTCVRDYIHIEDLCSVHALALEALVKGEKQGALAYNLGNGEDYSVQEVIDLARKVVGEDGRTITVEEGERRPGDPARLVADTTLASRELGWNPVYADLEPIIRHAWVWEKKLSGDGVV